MENKSIIEGLDKHLSKVNEVGEDPASVEKLILKRANGPVGKLIWEIIKPTILSQGGKFIAPNFNAIKPLLIADIKSEIKIMQKEGWNESPEEIAKALLDPAAYDEEIGDYVDTCFFGYYEDLYDGKSDLNVLMRHENAVMDYLKKEVKKNYKMLLAAVR